MLCRKSNMGTNKCLFLCLVLANWLILALSQQVTSCLNAKNQQGQCVDIRQCPHILDMVKAKITEEEKQFLQKSQCGRNGRFPKICCSTDTGTSGPESLLPTTKICGTFSQDRIISGGVTHLDEFPWMALIEYKSATRTTIACGGALINERYILTAAHCITRTAITKGNWTINAVRLGEHNLTSPIDCETFGNDYQDCAPPPINVTVEQTIVHESYNPNDINQYNDIALIRLSSKIEFTDFVKPVCLPKVAHETREGTRVAVVGWGLTENNSTSDVKLRLELPIASQTDCAEKFENKRVNLVDKQICAGGRERQDSCNGDSGGSLVEFRRDTSVAGNWFAVGVMSFGPSPCSGEGWPGVYTKVSAYVPWILSKLKP